MINTAAIQAVFELSLKLKPQETCLIVTDTVQESIARPFFNYLREKGQDVVIEVMQPLQEHGAEPPAAIAAQMMQCNVELLITSKSLSHTKARRTASRAGIRIASMPMITEDIINRCLDVDYEAVKVRCLVLYEILNTSHTIVITTARGTNITLQRGERVIHHSDGGVFDYKGAFGNLPEGEVSFGPITANGVYVIDGSLPTVGRLANPLTCTVTDGTVIDIKGEQATALKDLLDATGEGAYRIAELGIGTNDRAQINGNVLEDEKVLGTCHIAVGNDMSYGGTNDVPLHLDGVILQPTITVDGRTIMDTGKPLF